MLTLLDVDELLETAATLDSSTPAARLRGGRDDLVHAAVLLSYARHVLSVDIGALRAIAEAPAPAASARQAVEGAADGLMSAHGDLARIDFESPGEVEGALRELEMQRAMVVESREMVEMKVRELQALLVAQYKDGIANP